MMYWEITSEELKIDFLDKMTKEEYEEWMEEFNKGWDE